MRETVGICTVLTVLISLCLVFHFLSNILNIFFKKMSLFSAWRKLAQGGTVETLSIWTTGDTVLIKLPR